MGAGANGCRDPALADRRACAARPRARPRRDLPLGGHRGRARGGPAHGLRRTSLRWHRADRSRDRRRLPRARRRRPGRRPHLGDDGVPARGAGCHAHVARSALRARARRLGHPPRAAQRRARRARARCPGPGWPARHDSTPHGRRLVGVGAQGLRHRVGRPRVPPRLGHHRRGRTTRRAHHRAGGCPGHPPRAHVGPPGPARLVDARRHLHRRVRAVRELLRRTGGHGAEQHGTALAVRARRALALRRCRACRPRGVHDVRAGARADLTRPAHRDARPHPDRRR